MPLPPRLAPIADKLIEASAATGVVTLDEVGDAIGVVAVSTDDVDALLVVLESAGRRVVAPEGQRGVGNLRLVLGAARALAANLGRTPTIAEIASHTGLPEDDVRHAVALGRVMGR